MTKLITLAVFVLLSLASATADAGHEVLTDEGDNYIFDGQSWNTDQTGPTGTISIPLDFGTGSTPATRSFTLDPHGIVYFTSGGVNTGDFIAPLLAATPYAPASGITYATGLLDPQIIDPGTPTSPFVETNGLSAIRFYYNFVCPTAQPACGGAQFQAVLVSLNSEAFVLEFNYAEFNPAVIGTAGYHLGANVGSFAGPYSDVGPDYCFKNGVASAFTTIAACTGTAVTTPPTTGVPEPDVRSLVLLGGLLLAAASVVGRRQRTQRLAI